MKLRQHIGRAFGAVLEFLLFNSGRPAFDCHPERNGVELGAVGEGSPRSDLSGLAATLAPDHVTAQV